MSVSATKAKQRTYLRADDRRAQILEVAKQVFAERGYHEANVADICEAAKIGRGTLYQYFENKRDVLLEVVRLMCARISAILERRPPVGKIPGAAKAPREMIVAFCKARLREILDAIFVDEPTLRLLLRDARGHDGTVDAVLQEIDALVLGAIERDTIAARDAGLIRRVDPKVTALYVLGGMEKVILHTLTQNDAIDLDRIVDALVDIELFGIMKTP